MCERARNAAMVMSADYWLSLALPVTLFLHLSLPIGDCPVQSKSKFCPTTTQVSRVTKSHCTYSYSRKFPKKSLESDNL